jgi:hypothetical protein
MIVLAFLSWWYGRGWKLMFESLKKRVQGIGNAFSVSLLLRTLFAPWRRIITPPGASLADKFRALGDNIVSRVIGFIVRFFVLIGALISIVFVGLLSLIQVVLWPFIIPAIPILIVIGIVGIVG